MKHLKRMFGILFTVCLITAAVVPVLGAEEPYTYTVRIYAGKQGKIGGSEVVVYDNLKYGDRVTFHANSVVLNDNSKYYVRGLRESGKDNNTTGTASSFLVTQDIDYVVSYGLLGSSVAYTVNYVDTSGNALAKSETYSGTVGAQPVVAFLYIEGYQPQAYNLTATLKENAAKNVFTFVYTRITEADQNNNGNTTAGGRTGSTFVTGGGISTQGTTGGNTTGGTAAGENTANGNNADENDAEGDNDTAPEDQEEDDLTGTDQTQAEDNEPQEMINLDDEEVPLSENPNPNKDTDKEKGIFSKIPTAAKIGMIAGVLAAAAAAFYFFIWKKRKKKR